MYAQNKNIEYDSFRFSFSSEEPEFPAICIQFNNQKPINDIFASTAFGKSKLCYKLMYGCNTIKPEPVDHILPG